MTAAVVGALLLAIGALGIAVLALGTARPVPGLLDREAYLANWGGLHGGYDPRTGNRFLRVWLQGTFAVCGPLARRGVQPDALTLAGGWGVAAAAYVAGLGSGQSSFGYGPFAGGLLLAVTAPLDNIDGCVAILTDRVSSWGYVLDSCVDRVCDALALLALWAAGAPVWCCISGGAALGLLEYLRSRAVGAGFREVGVISVGERPNRIVACCLGLIAAGCLPSERGWLAGAGAAAVLGLSTSGLFQVGLQVRRNLRSGAADQTGDDLR